MVNRKNKIRSFKKKKTIKKRISRKRNSSRIKKQKGGGWASWEGAATMNNVFTPFIYNRFQRAPFLTEMGNLSPYV
jgi:hypothetical protein